MIDSYVENRGTGSFIIVDPTTNFTAGAGMIEVLRESAGGHVGGERGGRLARAARLAASDDEAC